MSTVGGFVPGSANSTAHGPLHQEAKVEADATTATCDGATAASEDEDEDVDGGMRAWSTVLGSMLIQFCGFGYCTAYGVFQDYYTRTYLTNASPSAISWIGSVNSCLSIGSSLFTGVLYDKGYFYHILYGGSFLMAFSLFMLSLAQPNQLYQIFLAQGIGFGLGSGLTYLPTIAIVSQHFKRRESLAMIFVISGASLGTLIFPIMLNKLFAIPDLGFRTSVQASAAVVSGLLFLGCLLIREKEAPTPVPQPGNASAALSNVWAVFKTSVRDPPFLSFCLSLGGFSVGTYYPIFFIQLDAIKHGVDEALSIYIGPTQYTIMNSAGLVGGLLPGGLFKLVGVEEIMVGSAAISAASVFAMLGLKDLGSTMAITVIFGLFVGMLYALQGPVVSLLTPDKSTFGTRLGIAFTFAAAGALVGPPIHGALLSKTFEWWKPAVFSGILSAAGAVGFAITHILHRRSQGSLAKQQDAASQSKQPVSITQV